MQPSPRAPSPEPSCPLRRLQECVFIPLPPPPGGPYTSSSPIILYLHHTKNNQSHTHSSPKSNSACKPTAPSRRRKPSCNAPRSLFLISDSSAGSSRRNLSSGRWLRMPEVDSRSGCKSEACIRKIKDTSPLGCGLWPRGVIKSISILGWRY